MHDWTECGGFHEAVVILLGENILHPYSVIPRDTQVAGDGSETYLYEVESGGEAFMGEIRVVFPPDLDGAFRTFYKKA